MSEDCRNPSKRLRAAASVVYQEFVRHEWGKINPGRETYEGLEKNDPIEFEEFNGIIAAALEAADAA